jgi:predicted DNA-binding transcriptional regulator AlpA
MARLQQKIVQEPVPALPEKLLDIKDVQKRLGVGRNRVFYLIAHEGLPCIRWGGKTLRFHPDALARWLAEQAM